MRKILITLACLFLSFTISNALYRHQIGQYDWDYRTIGDIDQVHFLKFHVAFSTKDGFVGVASAADGKVVWSKSLSAADPKVIFGNSAFNVLDSNARTVLTIEYLTGLKSNEVQLRDIALDEKILDFFYEVPESGQNTRIGILTAKHVYFIKGNNLEFKEVNSRGLTHLRYSSDKDAAYGVSSDKTKGTCIHRLPAKGQAANSERCFEVGGKNTDVHVHRNQVVARGPSSVTVAPLSGEGKVSHPLTSNARSVYLDNCDVLVTEKGDKCQIYSLRKGAFELVTSVDGSLATVSFGCNQESGNERHLVVTEVAGTSTIKVRRINLSSPSEAPKVLLNEVAKFSVGNIEKVFTDNLGFDSRVIIKTANLQILMIRDQKIVWKHEDSLSEIKQVQFFDYESLEEKDLNPYFENLDENRDSIIHAPTNFILRVKAQANKLVHGVNNLLKSVSTLQLHSLWETDPKFDKHNGLQKIIIAITRRNTVFGIDSKTGQIFWEKIIDGQWTVEGIFKTKRNHLVKEALLYLKDEKSKRSKLIHLNPLDGQLSSEEEFDRIPQELIPLHLAKSTAFVLVFGDNNVEFFPRSVNHDEVRAQLNDFSIYRIEKTSVTGYQLFGKSLVQTWNFNLPSKEEVLKTSNWSYDVEETEFKTIIPEDRKVIYKFSDSNNFALLSKSTFENPHVNLYIINGATGRVLHSKSQGDVDFDQPINLLYDENAIFVSFFNTKNLQSEIWVTELYKSELESSFTYLLERYFFEKLQTDEEAKYNNANPGFIAFSQKYFFVPGVKTFGAIETIHGVTKKNLIVVTLNDQIYSLDRGLLSTRRQLTVDGKAPESDPTSFGSSELPPYSPSLPVNNQKFLSYFKKYSGLKHVEASPTRFESTSLTFIYGHDVVYFRVAPEKEFDMLSEDFKYQYLLGSIGLILIGLIVVQRLSKKQKLTKLFSS